jgi:hypothetical protein
MNVTAPVGTVEPLAALTAATNVTGEFCVIVVSDAEIDVVVFTVEDAGASTVMETTLELEALKETVPE